MRMPSKVRRIDYTRDDGRQVKRLVIRCDCGLEVVCAQDVNECKCARDYNMSGQAMAPRNLWGEETGETAADILRGIGDDEWGVD